MLHCSGYVFETQVNIYRTILSGNKKSLTPILQFILVFTSVLILQGSSVQMFRFINNFMTSISNLLVQKETHKYMNNTPSSRSISSTQQTSSLPSRYNPFYILFCSTMARTCNPFYIIPYLYVQIIQL